MGTSQHNTSGIPGGPCRRTPRGAFRPSLRKASACCKGHSTAWRRRAFTSFSPPMLSHDTANKTFPFFSFPFLGFHVLCFAFSLPVQLAFQLAFWPALFQFWPATNPLRLVWPVFNRSRQLPEPVPMKAWLTNNAG